MAFKAMYLLALLYLYLAFCIQCTLSDSFFGTSYVKLPLEENTSVTEVSIRFRTSRSKGLLLYAFSPDSALVVRLRESKVEASLVFGDDEVTLQSRRRPKLNNLRWHQVQVTLSDGQGFLYVDGEQKDSGSVPRDSIPAENVYVGGTNDQKSHHVSGVDKYFRGCLEDVTVGNINVLAASVHSPGAIYHDITKDCSVEFEAGIDDPISFVKETAFVSFPKWHIQEEGSFACWIRTSAPNGLLMFSYQENNFIAAEIDGGHIQVLVQRESRTDSVVSEKIVNDMAWHFVYIDLAQNFIRISIDYMHEQFVLSSSFQEPINFLGSLYVGGVIHRARSLAFNSDLSSITHASTGGSLRGCLRDIELNGVQFALGDSHATHGIQVGCLYEFPCSLDPCGENTRCMETGLSDYNCECLGDGCTTTRIPSTSEGIAATTVAWSTATTILPSTTTTTLSTPALTTPSFTIFTLDPLSVMEGGGVLITSVNIRLNVNLREYNLRQSQVLFKMAQPPAFGVIEKDVLRKGDSRVQFTFLDLLTGKISYVHDGSENFEDNVVFDVIFSGKQDPVPGVTEDFNFTLPIIITPVNDPPEIVVADDNTFRMIRGTRRVLRSDFLHVIDPDTPSSNVTFTIVSQQGNVGFFEHAEHGDGSIIEYTQEDINEGKVAYVHTGPLPKSRIVLRAADLEEKSGLASFRIETAELALGVANLTVVKTNPSASQIIDLSNLRVVTNDPEDMFEVTYLVTAPPRLGDVQKLDQSREWIETSEFSHTDIQMNKVRYFASRVTEETEVSYDQIGLTARSGTVTKPSIFLPIQIVVTSIEVTTNTGLVLDIIDEGFITSQNLSSEAAHVLDGSPILYQVVRPPINGDIMKHLVGRIDEGQSFSQGDINSGLITYHLKSKFYSPFNDTFIFRATVSSSQTDAKEFIITYFPDSQHVEVTNNGFSVQEGGSHTLTTSDLFLETGASSDFSYTVTMSPLHGRFQMRDPASSSITIQNVTSFLNLDISRGALRYVHDDSETTYDYFEVAATATFNDRFGRRKQANWTGRVNITVELQNDNSPQRLINKVFNVIKNGRTVLTGEDILYTDADSDFDDGDLIYTRQKISAGDLVKTNNPTESILKFTQRDLLAGKVTFKHQGDIERTRMLFHVLDEKRKHYVAGFLQIQALESYVNVSVNTGLQVLKGQTGRIMSANLTAGTNINVKARNIIYQVTSGPMHGVLKSSDHFKVMVNNTEGKHSNVYILNITVLQMNDQPPAVDVNQGLLAIMGTLTPLTNASLSASDPDTPDTNLTYTITNPGNGMVVYRSRKKESILSFSQADLSNGDILFVHQGSRTGGFRFQVSDGVHTTQQQIFSIRASPLLLSLANNSQLTVTPGAIHPITSENLLVVTNEEPQTELSRPITFVVTTEPVSGEIVKILSEDAATDTLSYSSATVFTQEDINNDLIAFKHDNSSTLSEDSFQFDVFLPHSQNLSDIVFQIHIPYDAFPSTPLPIPSTTSAPTVSTAPEDDSGIINTGAEVSEGESVTITAENLDASILLSGLSGYVQYTVTKTPQNGFLSLSGRNITTGGSFIQNELSTQGLVYAHDHSDTLMDSFNFSATIKLFGAAAVASAEGAVTPSAEGIFRIQVLPVNDQTFIVVTASLRMSIVQGEQVIFNDQYLNITDPDNPPSELEFKVIQGPTNGRIVHIDDPAVDVKTFTQADINGDMLQFIHDGGSTLGAFTFRINDGKHYQIKQFFIDVVPRVLALTSVAPVVLTQGDTFAILSDEHLNISSNGNASTSFYNVTSPGNFGEIRLNSMPVMQFTQNDIELGVVEYHQTDIASDQDYLQLTLFDDYNVIPGISLNITIEPLIELKTIEALSGGDVPIMKFNLNATLLAIKTRESAHFTISEAAKYGTVVNSTSGEELQQFAFSDLDAGDIVYRANRLDIAENDTLVDNITMVLQAEGAQPVKISLEIVIGPEIIESTTQQLTTTEVIVRINTFNPGNVPIDDPFEDNGLTTETTSLEGGGPSAKAVDKGPSSIIYIALSIVIIFIIIIVILVLILWKRRHKKKEQKTTSQEENLPETVTAAPVIASTSSPPSQSEPTVDRSYESSAVTQPIICRPVQSPIFPQVKVTPLGRPPSPVNSYASLTSNGTFQSSALSNWTGCNPEIAPHHHHVTARSPTLKKSQYWV